MESVLSASLINESFEYLDVPVERIVGAGVPMPYAPNLEKLDVPQNEDRALWKLGTLPPGLLTFYKLIHPLNKS